MLIKKRKSYWKRVENDSEEVATAGHTCLLDLPYLVLDCILEWLLPEGLSSMAGVSKGLRERCVSDIFWEKHMDRKWGRVIGPTAHRDWQGDLAQRLNKKSVTSNGRATSLNRLSPFSFVASNSINMKMSCLPPGPVMSTYLALETGKLWFPAQVYNHKNGPVGYMLSCYDAELCYNPQTDSFQARYPPHGRRAVVVEKGVSWNRVRAAPLDISPHELHISECFHELRPGDHIEIQWRIKKEFPYGWWYGVVGHLESCDTSSHNHCLCHERDTVVLEFNQYNVGSQWRTFLINRKDHREQGNEAYGFYGGIRKLHSNDDISMWKQLWPQQVLE